jgi:uncharacterized BrkB/YihY/UPF0761 family membrane protein
MSVRARGTERARRSVDRAKEALRRLEGRRPHSRAIDGVFAAWERDRSIYGSTLAGALAFRMFLFLVPFTLVLVSIVGFAVSRDPGAEDRLSERFGLGGALASSIVTAADQSHASRWLALSIGLVGMTWAAVGAVRALRLAHSLAWGMTPRRLRRPHYGIVLYIAAHVLVLGVPLLTQWMRNILGLVGLIPALLGVPALYIALWVAASKALPRKPAPWTSLLPGALVVTAGGQALHLITVLVLAPRVEQSASVYGAIGVAVVLMTWLFIVARLVVSSAVVNAVVFERAATTQRD